MDDSEGIVPAPLTEVNAAAGAARSELLASVAQLPKRTNVAAAVETAAPDASILRFSPPVGGAVGPNGLSESLNGLFGPHAAKPRTSFYRACGGVRSCRRLLPLRGDGRLTCSSSGLGQ